MLFDPKLTLDQQQQAMKLLLAPISDDAPAGANVRSTPDSRELVRRIESLFRESISAERKLEEYRLLPTDDRPPAEPKWGVFLEQAVEFIQSTSKDLAVATLVAEASLREHGPRGFARGVELMTGLVDAYWPSLFPEQDPDSTKSLRFTAWKRAYEWPDLVAPQLEVLSRLTASGTTFAEYADAVKLDDSQLSSNVRDSRLSKGAKTKEMIQGEIRQNETFFKSAIADLLNCRSALQKLINLTREKCISPDPLIAIHLPDFGRTNDSIVKMIGTARAAAPPGVLPDETNSNSTDPSIKSDGALPPAENGAVVGTNVPSGQMTREAAFAQLKQLANFFRRTEPHSPISYAIEQTVRWGSLSLPDLLTELIENSESRKRLFERTGLPSPKPVEE